MSQPETKKNDKQKVWIGFDLGGTKMMAVVFDEDYKILGRKRRRTRSKSGGEVSTDRIIETIQMALEDASVSIDAVGGIGAGCPGQVDMLKGVIDEAPNLGWKNVALKKRLESAFDRPASICNDVDAGVYGEYRAGAAKGSRCVLGVFPGTGVGGGCVYEDRIFRGSRQSCMEVGFLQMATEGPTAGIGPVGTLEALASRLSIAAEVAKAAYRGQAPWLAREVGTDLTKIRSGVLASAIQEGDKEVERIIRRAAQQIGRGIGSMINLLAPDVVVLGGGLVEAMPEIYREEAAAGAKRNVIPALKDCFKIRVAELGDYAGVTGAAAWARRCADQPESD